jgi:hypothetical protein
MSALWIEFPLARGERAGRGGAAAETNLGGGTPSPRPSPRRGEGAGAP